MSTLSPIALVATVSTALTVALAAGWLVRPARRLAGRVRPYAVSARTSLGRSADVRAVARPQVGASALRRMLHPVAVAVTARLAASGVIGGEQALRKRLRQAGLFDGMPLDQQVVEYRIRQLTGAAAGLVLGLVAGAALPVSPAVTLLLVLCGCVVGATRWRARLDRAIEERRVRMRIELYTVNQLLAINIRVGGGVVQAVRRVVERGNGVLVDDLREVLVAHESGLDAREAFTDAATAAVEPSVARTFRLLAAGAEYGADLADALLGHSEDIRESRREALRRAATRRRATMLVPIIGILAPVMLLFIAAPLPSLVFGGLN